VTGVYRRSQTQQPCVLIGRFELNGDMSRTDIAFDTTAYRVNPRSAHRRCGQEPISISSFSRMPAMAVLVGRANWWPSRSEPHRKSPARGLSGQEQSERVRTPELEPA
jgi:hypothetical protein